MADFHARHIIEALRSGVPSRAVGECFSEARPGMMRKIQERMNAVRETGRSDGMLFTGRYGEGKTHLLNSAFTIAHSNNMVVSMVSLGKETPLDKPYLLYQKLMANTWLPGAGQPGFREKLESLTLGSGIVGELLAYCATELETDKLYYLLKAFLGTQDDEERFMFLSDLEGDFTTNAAVRKSYKRITGQTVHYKQNFSKTKHGMDYFYFMSHLFRLLGYDGWLILLDEVELIGRLGKKTRVKCYARMQDFLKPSDQLEQVFTLMAMSSSYTEDVIDKKRDEENAEQVFADDPAAQKAAAAAIRAIINAPELAPLTREEVVQVLMGIQYYHGLAYDWNPDISEETLYKETEKGGYLLRTKIRAAIEFLDQLYQYGEAGNTRITELGKESFEEDDTPELPDPDQWK